MEPIAPLGATSATDRLRKGRMRMEGDDVGWRGPTTKCPVNFEESISHRAPYAHAYEISSPSCPSPFGTVSPGAATDHSGREGLHRHHRHRQGVATDEMRCQIDDVVIQSLKIGAVFHEPFRAHINSLDFHREDALLVTPTPCLLKHSMLTVRSRRVTTTVFSCSTRTTLGI